MKIIADTNLIVRVLLQDDNAQAALAQRALRDAELVALPTAMLCEVIWVVRSGYRVPVADLLPALQRLLNSANVVIDRPIVEAGLNMMAEGGDFADGALPAEGRRLGGETFLSFDRKAVRLLKAQGVAADLLG